MKSEDESITLINMRVLSKLKAGDRLQCVDSRYFSIDRGWFVWLTRWVRNDNRANTVDRIEEAFKKAHGMEPYPDLLIKSAVKGVKELLATYVGDETTCARLEHIMDGKGLEQTF